MIDNVLFARQPIFDAQLNTVAYELLYRSEKGESPGDNFDEHGATVDVLLSTYCNIMENGHLRVLPAYINFLAPWLYDKELPSVPSESLILEVHDDPQHQTDVNCSRLSQLNASGYQIALDQYDHEVIPDAMVNLANIVKLDVQKFSDAELAQQVSELKGRDITLLAQKVETYNEFDYCKQLGFELFQGYFFAKPQLVKGRKLNSNASAILQLIGALSDESSTFEELEKLIVQDPELTLGILRVVNSSRFRRVREITRISEAIAIIGLNELKKWALLIALQKNTEKPSELVRTILMKARMCELAAARYPDVTPASAFLVGILSGVEALLDLPQEIVLGQLPLHLDLKHALQGSNNSLGSMLQDIEAYMHGDWSKVNLRTSSPTLNQCYDGAVDWSNETLAQLT